MKKSISNFPNPSAFPFFYGYFIVFLGTLGVWASLPGQTVGVSTFTDPVKSILGLSRDQLSTAYMLGTIGSSLLISRAGRWFDRFGARTMATTSAFVLAISLFIASFTDLLSIFIQTTIGWHHWVVPFSVITFIFFLFRFSGQGVLTMSSRNMVMKWFERYRGRANAFNALSISLGFSMAPILIDSLITRYDWDGAWRLMGFFMLGMAVIAFVFFRDNPEKYGLIPDGKPKPLKSKAIEAKELRNFEPEEAFKTRAFWVIALMLAFNSFFFTGFTFHVVSIFESAGFEREIAIAVFVPISVISVSFSLTFNFISDYIRVKYLLYIMILGGFLSSIGLTALGGGWGLYVIVVGIGITGGMFAVLNAIAWPRLFGRKYIGTISGKGMSMIVFASALAPILFSLSHTHLNSYIGVAWLSVAYMVFITFAAVKVKNPRLTLSDGGKVK